MNHAASSVNIRLAMPACLRITHRTNFGKTCGPEVCHGQSLTFLDRESLRAYDGEVMNKSLILVGLAACVCFASASDGESIECKLQSLTRNYAAKPVEPNAPRWARKYADVPLTVELKLAVPSEQKVIQEISAGNIAITDAKGNSLEWSLSEKESIRGVAKGVTVFKIHTVPQGDWVEIKGDLKAQVSGDIITHPAQSVKMGEKGKLNIPGLDITVEWDKDDELELSTTGKQSRAIADCSFKTPSGAEAEILHSSTMSGMNEVSLGYGFEDGIKEVSVIMKTYGEPKTVTVPVHKRIGFSGELKAE